MVTLRAEKGFYKRALQIAVPIMIQNGITNFVSMLDNIMVGRVGTDPMSGVAIVNELLFVWYLALFGGLSGIGIFTAQFCGKKDHKGVRYTFRLMWMLVIVLVIAGIVIFRMADTPLISLFLHEDGGSGNLAATLQYAERYLSVMVIGHQKGRDTKERTLRNFGMPRPEGYRKAMRLMKLAERFRIPVITFIDTPGAYPGVGAEERSQAGAIAESLKLMSCLQVPVICTVIGEGGSGGALAIGVGDRVNMLQYSTYSVISPEGCASILWKSADKASLAAEAMRITAKDLKELKLIDNVIEEPLGGAHRDYDAVANSLKVRLLEDINDLLNLPGDRLIEQRYSRLMSYGY